MAEEAGEVEVALPKGDVTEGVVRVGATVRRPRQPQSAYVQAYLGHLERVGFAGAPRFLGVDEQGRDVLDYVDGDVPGAPPEAWACTDEVVAEIGRLVRRLHDASAGFSPPPELAWFGRDAPIELPPELADLVGVPELVAHCDVTPQNVVFRGGRPVALIDFDLARPTRRVLDLLTTAMWWVPLQAPADRAPADADVDVAARLARHALQRRAPRRRLGPDVGRGRGGRDRAAAGLVRGRAGHPAGRRRRLSRRHRRPHPPPAPPTAGGVRAVPARAVATPHSDPRRGRPGRDRRRAAVSDALSTFRRRYALPQFPGPDASPPGPASPHGTAPPPGSAHAPPARGSASPNAARHPPFGGGSGDRTQHGRTT